MENVDQSADKRKARGPKETSFQELTEREMQCRRSRALDQLINAKPEMDAILKSVIPMKRYGKASEIADAIVWLASDQTKFMTGQTITLDGGTSL